MKAKNKTRTERPRITELDLATLERIRGGDGTRRTGGGGGVIVGDFDIVDMA